MEAPTPLRIENTELSKSNQEIKNKKEYIFEINNIKYKLFVYIQNKYINFKIIKLDEISLFNYNIKYELKQIINILNINNDLYDNLSKIMKLIDDAYLNNKISINNNINNEINIKIKLTIGFKEYKCIIKLNKKRIKYK